MANNYNGKHICKNHPKVNNKGTIILASLVLASSLSIYAMNKNNKDEVVNIDSKEEYSTLINISADSILSSLKSKYITQDDYGLTFEGLVINYFESQIKDLPENEKQEKINFLLQDNDIESKIFNYVVTNSPLPIKTFNFKDNPNIKDNLNKVLNNEELMKFIEEFSQTYGESKDKIIAIIAQNSKGIIDTKNPMGIGNNWYNLDSKYSVYNYDKNENQTIVPLKKEFIHNIKDAILYNIIVSQSSIKQSGGNGVESLAYLKYGPNLLTISSEEEENLNNTIDEVLSYLVYYHKRNSFNLTTNYTLNSDNKQVITERVQAKEYTYYVINDVINNLNMTLNQDFNKTLN